MKETVDSYDKENIDKSEYITPEVLEKEKQLEKRRRYLASLDIN